MRPGEMLSKMLVLMANGHAGQFDKSGKPYSLHPLAVMSILNSDDEELQCIALGHDLVWTCWPVFYKEDAWTKIKASTELIVKWPAYLGSSREKTTQELQPDGYLD